VPETDLTPEVVDLTAFDVIVDVRLSSRNASTIPGSIHVGLEALLADPPTTIPSIASRVLVVCDVGVRSGMAARSLGELGYSNALSLAGGLEAWRAAGRALDTSGMSDQQAARYDRQIKLEDVGVSGQRSLLDATVTIVGAGGLGLPVISYLAAAGVGGLRVIDGDTVELSNLHRQPLYREGDVGSRKVHAIAEWVRGLDAAIAIEAIPDDLDAGHADRLLDGSDVIVDATDRFDARYAISDGGQRLGIPVVSGAVYRWEGQVLVLPPGGPCYRCAFPAPPEGVALDCAITGVAGPVVGTVGAMMATAVLRLLLGHDVESPSTLTVLDGRTGRTDIVRVPPRSDCRGPHS
jgi:molybdopterin/thiamine biosynthesis adenylyltransferase